MLSTVTAWKSAAGTPVLSRRTIPVYALSDTHSVSSPLSRRAARSTSPSRSRQV
ncbi:hypothetical protein [Streptomyces sp. NPDC056105]|uniref:hypothetical protein n=1 Tax=Streptomyces sp. NPDC056105 TaxID=3345714 RepID=UPI0035E19A80